MSMVTARPLKQKWTAEKYLTFEDASDTKHELIDGQIYDMSGASPNHNLIAARVMIHLGGQLSKRPTCYLYTSDQRVYLPTAGAFVYPDLSMLCGQPEYDRNSLLNPTVLVEVLSPATENYDRELKFARYQTLPSLKHYVVIAQDRPQITVHTFQSDATWSLADAIGRDAVIALEHIDCMLALAEVYAQITFDEPAL